jgi:hypothetical protein
MSTFSQFSGFSFSWLSLDTMAPKSWSKGTSRHAFLESRLPAFIAACNSHTLKTWFLSLYYEWFQKYPWDVAVNEEPAPDYEAPVSFSTEEKEKAIRVMKEVIYNFTICLLVTDLRF